MKLEPQKLYRPLSLQQFVDGKLYKLPDIEFSNTPNCTTGLAKHPTFCKFLSLFLGA
ncbi:hypothetical protein H8E77_01930 [bacterium]|nr:hypothetical protein [bacterium]